MSDHLRVGPTTKRRSPPAFDRNVVVNVGDRGFDDFDLPWHWSGAEAVEEVGEPVRESSAEFVPDEERATLSLAPFQVRVFRT